MALSLLIPAWVRLARADRLPVKDHTYCRDCGANHSAELSARIRRDAEYRAADRSDDFERTERSA